MCGNVLGRGFVATVLLTFVVNSPFHQFNCLKRGLVYASEPSSPKLIADIATGFRRHHGRYDYGNQCVGHAAMEVIFLLNRYETEANIDEQESMALGVAVSQLTHEA